MMLRILLYCLVGGSPMTIGALGAGHAAWWWLSGIVLAAAFVPVALYGPRGIRAQFAVIAPALFVISVFCVWTEAVVFVPQLRPDAVSTLVGSTIMHLLVAAALATLAGMLKLNQHSNRVVPRRAALATAAIVVVCGMAYVLYYLVFGAITFEYFTRDFYPEAVQQVAQLGWWFWAMQLGRGVLMTLAVLPVVYTLRMERWQAALAVGAVLWIAGGLAPLLVPNDLMGTTQRAIHIVEIFTQNASLGITVVLLARPRSQRALATSSPVRIG